jgi:hypothetical protein
MRRRAETRQPAPVESSVARARSFAPVQRGERRQDLRGLSDCTLKKVWSPIVATW